MWEPFRVCYLRMRLLLFPTMILLTAVLALASGPTVWIARFSENDSENLMEEWETWEFSNVPRTTRYSLSEDEGITVLKAESSGAASALMKSADIDAIRHPVLAWRWKTDGPIVEDDWNNESDDYPLRLFVIFEGKSGLLGVIRRAVGGFNGRALNYVWVPESAGVTEASASPATDRVQMIPIRQGSARFGTWASEKRNVVEDYLEAFGEEPGRIIGFAVMTDTDGTGGTCTSYFGDIGMASQ